MLLPSAISIEVADRDSDVALGLVWSETTTDCTISPFDGGSGGETMDGATTNDLWV